MNFIAICQRALDQSIAITGATQFQIPELSAVPFKGSFDGLEQSDSRDEYALQLRRGYAAEIVATLPQFKGAMPAPGMTVEAAGRTYRISVLKSDEISHTLTLIRA